MSKELMAGNGRTSSKGQFLVYETEDGQVKIDVRLEDETVWLTQQLMVELAPESTHKKYLSVRQEGNREVKRLLDYYNYM